MEQVTKTGQLFLGSKFAGVASTATALSGTGLPPCPAYDFSCALRGTFARTVEPGEKGTPANLKEGSAAFAVNAEQTFSVTNSWATKSDLFKKLLAGLPKQWGRKLGYGSSSNFTGIAACAVHTIHFAKVSEEASAYPILRRASAK